MPIKKENGKYYKGKVWKYFRAWALERADNRCQFCRLQNYAVVNSWRVSQNGVGHPTYKAARIARSQIEKTTGVCRLIIIVLTIAHLDHNPENNHPDNLCALCQKCHLNHDKDHHAKNAAETRRRKKTSRKKAAL